MSPTQFPVVLFAKAAISRNFEALKTGRLRIFSRCFEDLGSLLRLIFEAKMQEPFGSHKKYLNIEIFPLF